MTRFALPVLVAVFGVAAPLSAQFRRPLVVGYTVSYGYGWGVFWVEPRPVIVVPPPVIIVRPATGPWVEEPPRPPEPVRADPVERAAAEARVQAAVDRGELLVIKAGNRVARVPAPPERIDRPPGGGKPAVTLDRPKLPADPKALAVFRVEAGRAAFAAGEYGRAADLFRAAADTDPSAFFLLAQARTARGEYAEAVAAIRDGMRQAPDWPAARFRIADVYGDRRQPLADHLTALRDAAARPTAPAARFLYAYHLWFAGQKAAAANVFRALSPTVKDNAEIERFLQAAEGKDV